MTAGEEEPGDDVQLPFIEEELNMDFFAYTNILIDWEDVQQLYDKFKTLFFPANLVHMAGRLATIVDLDKLGHQERANLNTFLDALFGRIAQYVRAMAPEDVATAVWAAGELGHRSEAFNVVVMEKVSTDMEDFTVMELANILWAYARAGLQPQGEWVHSMLVVLQAVWDHRTDTPFMARTLTACAMMEHMPPEEWMDWFVEVTQEHLGELELDACVDLLWAIDSLGYAPETAWLAALLAVLLPRLGELSPARMCTLVECFAANELPPGVDVVGPWCDAIVPLLPKLSGHEVACCLAALAAVVSRGEGGGHVEPTWLNRVAQRLHVARGGLDARMWSLTWPALAELTQAWPQRKQWVRERQEAVRDLSATTRVHFAEMNVPALLGVLKAMARLGYMPGLNWLRRHEAELAAKVYELDDDAVRSLDSLYAYYTFRPVTEEVQARLLAAGRRSL